LSRRQALLGFVALYPTYMFRCYYEMRNPTTANFETETQKFRFLINPAVFLASGRAACPAQPERRSGDT